MPWSIGLAGMFVKGLMIIEPLQFPLEHYIVVLLHLSSSAREGMGFSRVRTTKNSPEFAGRRALVCGRFVGRFLNSPHLYGRKKMRRLLLCVVVSGMLSGCTARGSYHPHMCCEISVLADTIIIAGAALLLRGAIRGSSTRERVSVH